MNIRMIIDRMDDWYYVEDAGTDPFFYSIILLEKLSTNLKKGIDYNRVELISNLGERKNMEALSALDQAIIILSSRDLITIEIRDNKTNKIYITTKGLEQLKNYREEYDKL